MALRRFGSKGCPLSILSGLLLLGTASAQEPREVIGRLQVNAIALDYSADPDVAFVGDEGHFVIAWLDYQQGRIYFRLFDGAGQPLIEDSFVVDGTAYWAGGAAVAPLPNGDFVVVWSDGRGGPGESDVYSQYVDAVGRLVGTNVRLDEGLYLGGVESPDLALWVDPDVPADGRGLVTWTDVRGDD